MSELYAKKYNKKGVHLMIVWFEGVTVFV